MRASRRRAPVPPPGTVVLAVLVFFARLRTLRSSAAAAAEEGTGGGGAGSPPPFSFAARLAADLFKTLAPLGGARALGPEELDRLRESLDVGVRCEPDRFLPAKRMPATLSLPRLVARIEGGSCRARARGAGPERNETAAPTSPPSSSSPLLLGGGLVSCSPAKTSWFYQEPLLLPERTTPAALFAGSCSLSLYPSSMKVKEAEAAATAANKIGGSGGIIDAAFSAAPPLASSNVKRVQILSPVVVTCESLEALKRGECSVVAEGPLPHKGKGKEGGEGSEGREKKRSRRAKEAAVAATGGGAVLPSAGAVAAEVGREVYEALRAQ